jgi:hypothetical protein
VGGGELQVRVFEMVAAHMQGEDGGHEDLAAHVLQEIRDIPLAEEKEQAGGLPRKRTRFLGMGRIADHAIVDDGGHEATIPVMGGGDGVPGALDAGKGLKGGFVRG